MPVEITPLCLLHIKFALLVLRAWLVIQLDGKESFTGASETFKYETVR